MSFYSEVNNSTKIDIKIYSHLLPMPLFFLIPYQNPLEGAAVSWLVRSSPDRAVWVPALAGDIVLCSWARHFTLTVPLSGQVHK